MRNKEIGIYVHIPFCVKKCDYCDFLSVPAGIETQMAYVRLLKEEIRRTAALSGETKQPVRTIFFGGGTPSILPSEALCEILDEIGRNFQLRPYTEITLESNPGTLTEQKLRDYRAAGFNRISVGLQSASDKELSLLGRIHTYDDFLTGYDMIRRAGFENVNVDLMSALPGQTMRSYTDTLKKVIALRPEHISAYSLIIEEGTPFFERYGEGRGEGKLPDEDDDRLMYQETGRLLAAAGYDRYEISNYSRPGYECRHNVIYWTGDDYLGFGLGASSYYNGERYSNVRSLLEYRRAAGDPERLHIERETLTMRQKMEEFMFLGLRLSKGISTSEFYHRFHVNYKTVYGEVTARLYRDGLLHIDKGRVWLTDYGVDVSNVVLAEFLLDGEIG